jgi:hypothetical protein
VACVSTPSAKHTLHNNGLALIQDDAATAAASSQNAPNAWSIVQPVTAARQTGQNAPTSTNKGSWLLHTMCRQGASTSGALLDGGARKTAQHPSTGQDKGWLGSDIGFFWKTSQNDVVPKKLMETSGGRKFVVSHKKQGHAVNQRQQQG